eukprot:TRINITY_DN941_c0_g1_i1.p1 TRINITY_DN941_c0_g1~~TRINITY_DN941_c0_g1_i1.p1  ORF type:complete len:887 (+),score=248.11 TRINITY_DN941_c0_g1_i1:45-2705(+)
MQSFIVRAHEIINETKPIGYHLLQQENGLLFANEDFSTISVFNKNIETIQDFNMDVDLPFQFKVFEHEILIQFSDKHTLTINNDTNFQIQMSFDRTNVGVLVESNLYCYNSEEDEIYEKVLNDIPLHFCFRNGAVPCITFLFDDRCEFLEITMQKLHSEIFFDNLSEEIGYCSWNEQGEFLAICNSQTVKIYYFANWQFEFQCCFSHFFDDNIVDFSFLSHQIIIFGAKESKIIHFSIDAVATVGYNDLPGLCCRLNDSRLLFTSTKKLRPPPMSSFFFELESTPINAPSLRICGEDHWEIKVEHEDRNDIFKIFGDESFEKTESLEPFNNYSYYGTETLKKVGNFHLNTLNQLFFEKKFIVDSVTSILRSSHEKILLVTQKTNLLFIDYLSGDIVFERMIEKGARLITSTEEGILLLMPRGNFEMIYPRMFTLTFLNKLWMKTDENMSEAFIFARRHRISPNFFIDINPKKFQKNLPAFLKVVDFDYFLFILGSLKNENSLLTSSEALLLIEPNNEDFNFDEKRIIVANWTYDATDDLILKLICCSMNLPAWDKEFVKILSELRAIDDGNSKMALKGLDYVCQGFSNAKQCFASCLHEKNFELASFVGSSSQFDPQWYENVFSLINNEKEEWKMMFKIHDELDEHDAVINIMVQHIDEQNVSEIIEYAERWDLIEHLMLQTMLIITMEGTNDKNIELFKLILEKKKEFKRLFSIDEMNDSVDDDSFTPDYSKWIKFTKKTLKRFVETSKAQKAFAISDKSLRSKKQATSLATRWESCFNDWELICSEISHWFDVQIFRKVSKLLEEFNFIDAYTILNNAELFLEEVATIEDSSLLFASSKQSRVFSNPENFHIFQKFVLIPSYGKFEQFSILKKFYSLVNLESNE